MENKSDYLFIFRSLVNRELFIAYLIWERIYLKLLGFTLKKQLP